MYSVTLHVKLVGYYMLNIKLKEFAKALERNGIFSKH